MHRLALAATLFAAAAPAAMAVAPALTAAIASPDRDAKLAARDGARHPAELLTFYGVTPRSTVVEIWPGGGYWTEILAPYLHADGTYYAALGVPGGSHVETAFAQLSASAKATMAAKPALYDRVHYTQFGKGHPELAPAGSADVVLTFRNLHNWMSDGDAPELLASIHRALKPGGILGIEDHRARPTTPQDPQAKSGYVRQDYAVKLIEAAGFRLVGSSEIAANPKDTTDWPKGVWTLPPSLAMGDVDRAKYVAIGEADSFELKFRKVGR